jgi:Helix-turn-helix domain
MPMQPLAGTLPLAQLVSRPIQPRTPIVRSARSRNRAAAWAHDAAQWRAYQLARHPDASDVIEAEYAKLIAAGPDFVRYHDGSGFHEAPLHNITKADRLTMLQAFDTIRSGLYRHGRRPRAQVVSRAYRDVLGVLLSYGLHHRRVYPSLATIARLAMCSVRTVQRALDWLRLFGFLAKLRRLVRERTPLGNGRCRQTSNAYRLTTRLAGLGAMALNVFAGRSGHHCRPSIDQRLVNEKYGESAAQFGSLGLVGKAQVAKLK